MASWTGEEVADGLERWLKAKRDQYDIGLPQWAAIDALLDDARECHSQGWMVWSRQSLGRIRRAARVAVDHEAMVDGEDEL